MPPYLIVCIGGASINIYWLYCEFMTEEAKAITSRAEQKFGNKRTEELQLDLEQLASDIEKVRAVAVETDDEP